MSAHPGQIRTAGQSITGHGQTLQSAPEPSGLGSGCLGHIGEGTLGALNTHIQKVGTAVKSMGGWLCTCGGRLGSNADAIEETERTNAERFSRLHDEPTENTPLLHGNRSPSPRGLDPVQEQQTVAKLHEFRQTNWDKARGQRNDALTLDPQMQQVLDQHARRTDKPVPASVTYGMEDKSSTDGPLRMNHKVTFDYPPGTDPSKYQYIRFSKATRISGNHISHTEPGYVRYSGNAPLGGPKPTDHGQLDTALDNGFQHAQWSVDGPHKPFADDARTTNVDTPGMAWMTKTPHIYPYGLKTEFYGVLYDPEAGRIMNVTHYQDSLTKPNLSTPAQHSAGQ